VIGIILVALWAIRSILLLTFTAVILVIFFSIPIRRLTMLTFPGGRKIGRPTAIALTLLGVVVVLILLSLMVFPQVFEQFGSLFSRTIPQGVEAFVEWWDDGRILYTIPFLQNFDLTDIAGTPAPRTLGITGLDHLGIMDVRNWNNTTAPLTIDQDALQNIGSQLLAALGQVGGTVLPLLGGVANMLLSSLIVLFISLYFLAEPHRYVERIILYTPVWYRGRMRLILDRIDDAIRAWLKITGVSMLVAGVLTGLLLWLVAGLDTQWLALGTIAGLASFIPNFGPILALIPAVLVGAVQAPQNIGWIILIVYGVSFIQSQIVSPIMANEDMKMPPVLILVGQIVFGIFFGFLGLMFAVPMTAIFLVLMDEIYVKDVLGDKQSVPDETVIEPLGITG
jgi:predicted PurR-regulated permease PerM